MYICNGKAIPELPKLLRMKTLHSPVYNSYNVCIFFMYFLPIMTLSGFFKVHYRIKFFQTKEIKFLQVCNWVKNFIPNYMQILT